MEDAHPAIAIVGIACRYPDAGDPQQLWQNVLSQRRAFRRIPSSRLSLADYFSSRSDDVDGIYIREAALLAGYEFDRVRFRIGGRAFRSADLVHWLALDVAAQALADAGFPDGKDLDRDETGVLVGNTLTGEFSRANLMRLRWPYVRRQVAAALARDGVDPERRAAFLADLERHYKAPFPENDEDSLAGGLSNTIAGRICNYFDLHGGGYTVDGACSSSLLAVINACSALVAGDLEVALAGGVDLSLDPFELVGFARAGALAQGEMRVYDRRSAGFLPGEGCGFVVLMRHADALAQGRRVYALIRGWGISSDGSGGLIRPEVDGQILALRRAYRRAGFGADTVGLFEGHGTGTAVGDAVELRMLTRARREADPRGVQPPAALGSIKANVGHTKAAAGIASLIKATMAVSTQLLPPTTACDDPRPEAAGGDAALRVLRQPEAWPAAVALRAGVSAMGFGGINSHVVLESPTELRRPALSRAERRLGTTPQDAELLLLGAPSVEALAQRVAQLERRCAHLSRGELTDLAAALAREAESGAGGARAALVAATPAELRDQLATLRRLLADGVDHHVDPRAGTFLARSSEAPRIGFLFPGQGAAAHLGGGVWSRRFAAVAELYAAQHRRFGLPLAGDGVDTAVAQPAIATASLAGLTALTELGIDAAVAVGHSLGELVALHWAGVLDAEALARVATARGRAMSELGSPTGAMASVAAAADEVAEMLAERADEVAVTGFNSPRQSVISGGAAAVDAAVERARERGWKARRLAVSHAFHSPLVAAATPRLAAALDREELRPLDPAAGRRICSTVTGDWLADGHDVRQLLSSQVTAPVRFTTALQRAAAEVDILLEVGPGTVLSGLVRQTVATPVIALDAGGPSLRGLLRAAGACFALGAPVVASALFADRFTRPFDLAQEPTFLINPCELAPVLDLADGDRASAPAAAGGARSGQESAAAEIPAAVPAVVPATVAAADPAEPIDVVRRLLAERTELPVSALGDDSRLLSDLHLSSIAVGELVSEAARQLSLAPPAAPTEYADATVAEVARALSEIAAAGGTAAASGSGPEPPPPGLAPWVRPFTVEWVERPARRAGPDAGDAVQQPWQLFAPAGHPFTATLAAALTRTGGSGTLLFLPRTVESADESDPAAPPLDLLLAAARAALADRDRPVVVVQQQPGAAGFFRTLHLESPQTAVTVVNLPGGVDLDADAAAWSARAAVEARANQGFVEVRYDGDGRRFEPVLRLLPAPPEPAGVEAPLGGLTPSDVVVVSGGGKGIGAECALALARRTGARLALLGRASPEDDRELAANLDRFAAHGVTFRYLRADVTDRGAVADAVARAETELGPVTALLHSAGANRPRLLAALERADCEQTLAPKVAGLASLLAAVAPQRLKLLVGFGSIIGRIGLRGEADYALANEQLRTAVEAVAAAHPECRCLCVEWSVWSGVGMGARLSHLDALARQGITPITPDAGVAALERLLARPTPVSVVVTGRFGEPPTLAVERPELPLLRFLERPRVYFPGVELVADSEVSLATDPYLADHVFDGERLFPAVMGLEAMAQGWRALTGDSAPPVFRDLRFTRALSVPRDGATTVRLIAQALSDGRVEVAVRSAQTAFQTDHFRAVLEPAGAPDEQQFSAGDGSAAPLLPLDPAADLYGPILFQSGRFQRLRGYRQLSATACLAEIAPAAGSVSWFGPYLPAELLLGDPGVRDACIHGVQACIPHATVLPIQVDRLERFAPNAGTVLVAAQERTRDGKTLTYDLEVRSESGELVERWHGLALRIVGAEQRSPRLAPPLLGPYLERRLYDLLPGSGLAVAFERNGHPDRRVRSDRALARALGGDDAVFRRPDGKPETTSGVQVSVAHSGELVLAVAGTGTVGCDIEAVASRSSEMWHDLLGSERRSLLELVRRESGDDLDDAATRVWTVIESLKKSGQMPGAPIVFEAATPDGWVLFHCGHQTAATVLLPAPGGTRQRLSCAVLAERRDAGVSHREAVLAEP